MTTARQYILTIIFVAVSFSIVTGGISYGPADDAYEENDTLETAWSPGGDWEDEWLSSISGLGIQADEDWYEIYVSPGYEHVLVECPFGHSEGDIDICLVDSQGDILSCSTGIWDNESIDVVVPASGTYYTKSTMRMPETPMTCGGGTILCFALLSATTSGHTHRTKISLGSTEPKEKP